MTGAALLDCCGHNDSDEYKVAKRSAPRCRWSANVDFNIKIGQESDPFHTSSSSLEHLQALCQGVEPDVALHAKESDSWSHCLQSALQMHQASSQSHALDAQVNDSYSDGLTCQASSAIESLPVDRCESSPVLPLPDVSLIVGCEDCSNSPEMQPANSTVSAFDQSHEWQNFRKRDDCNKQATTLKRSFSSDHTGPVSVYERGAAWLERKHQRQLVMREEAVRRQDKECTFQPCFHSCHDGRDRLPFTQERARLFFERNVSWRMHLDEIQQHQR